MAARLSAKRLPRYSLQFKRGAVRLTEMPGMEVQVVARALDIHPVMLSRWRQESREGRLRGISESLPKRKVAPPLAALTGMFATLLLTEFVRKSRIVPFAPFADGTK